jgi:hypothetical protein
MITYNNLILMGLIFELFGALFLSMEAIRPRRFKKVFKYFKRYSDWIRAKFYRAFISIIIYLIPIMYSLYTGSDKLAGFVFPSVIIMLFMSELIDNPERYEKWVLIKTTKSEIGPIGFLFIVFGNLLQLISISWQMIVK